QNEIGKMVTDFQKSPLYSRIQKAKQKETEIPFSKKEGDGLIEGTLDLAFEEDGGWVIVDYKTDRVDQKHLRDRVQTYKPQIQLYSDALSALSKKNVKESLLYFARLGQTVPVV